MGQALKVIKFNEDENLSEDKLPLAKVKSKTSSIIVPLKIAATLTAILGVISLILEVSIYFQYRYEIYLARLFPTIFAFITLILLQSKFGKKKQILIAHIFLFSIFASLSFVVYKVPTFFTYNITAASLFVLVLSQFVNWGKNNQLILSVYFLGLFGVAAILGGVLDFRDQSLYVNTATSISLLVVSIITSHLNSVSSYRSLKSKRNKLENNTDRQSQPYIDIFNESLVPLYQITLEGEFENVNKAFCELLEIANEEDLSELNFFDNFIKNDNVKKHLVKKIESKGRVENYRVSFKKNDGSEEILILDCKSKMIDDQVYLEGSLRNVTEQFNKDNELLKELESLRKIKNKGINLPQSFDSAAVKRSNVISKMGHELRTPMNSVLGFLTLIENGLFENDEELKEFSHSAKLSAESLLGLLNDVVEIAKIQEGSVEIDNTEFNIHEEIDKINTSLAPHIKQNNINFSCSIAEDVPENILLDKSKYSQILINLLRNAIQAAEDGDVNLTISKKVNDKGQDQLVTNISDNGKAIPQSILDKLVVGDFESKEKGSKITSGVLHIMICKELLNLLNGKLSAKLNEKSGTTFCFTLDIESNIIATDENAIDGTVESVELEGKPKLLLVEDNPISRKVEQKLLHEAGYNVDCVENGKEAIEYVKKGIYNLVLMDIELKDMDGLEATKIIRELSDDMGKIPIIAVTAHSSMKDREKCLLAGMNDYISKPINITFLKMTIDQWLQQAKVN